MVYIALTNIPTEQPNMYVVKIGSAIDPQRRVTLLNYDHYTGYYDVSFALLGTRRGDAKEERFLRRQLKEYAFHHNGVNELFLLSVQHLEAIICPERSILKLIEEAKANFLPKPDITPEKRQVSFKLPMNTINDIKAICYWERKEQWQLIVEAVQDYVKEYEKKNGALKPIPMTPHQ